LNAALAGSQPAQTTLVMNGNQWHVIDNGPPAQQ